MVASLIPIMSMLTSGPLGPLLSPNPLDADDLRPITNTGHIIEKAQMDSETQQYITDNLPKTRLKYIMRTQGVATSATHPGVFSGNVGERLMEEEGDLFAPQLLGQLPDLHYIAKLSGGRIVKGRLPVLRSSLDTGKA